ncbi:MAG: riboflavin biosynthesis protein RibF [Clostridia bacterium]|nr:riboflavin biosynthesis protein RibF [Clostridia bacterium]
MTDKHSFVSPGLTVVTRDGSPLCFEGKRVTLALGTFDGVHIAHRALLDCAIEQKHKLSASLAGAFCFAESPISVLRGIHVPTISTREEKLRLMFEAGLDFVAIADFAEFRDVSAEQFVKETLCRDLSCVGAVCGFNHRFGKGGAGDSSLLSSILGEENVITYPEVKLGGETVSSTAIRAHLAAGELDIANKMLGRPFSLSAPVLAGKKLGRTIGCPTTNQLFPGGSVNLCRGIYATLCYTEGGSVYVGASNVGVRPTIDGALDDHSFNCETLIADFSGDLYGQNLTLEFHKYLRPECKFGSLDELSAAIRNDLVCACEYFEGIAKN